MPPTPTHPDLRRRRGLQGLAAFLAAGPALHPARATPTTHATAVQLAAVAWRAGAAPAADDDPKAHRVSLLALDWAERRSHWRHTVALPSRAHGVLADGHGGCFAVAARPGDWLLHLGADGEPRWLRPARDEGSPRSLNGHLLPSADGRALYSTETRRDDGSAWLVRRDAQTLRTQDAWPLPGVDAHQMLLDADGRQVLVAIGGIARDAQGRKTALERMAPALLQVDGESGAVRQRWSLPDARLSVRHMAWSRGGESPLVGIGLQAEHADPARRARAPLLALWDGRELTLPRDGHDDGGYVGDICAGPGGSFLLSAQRQGRAVLWHPDAPGDLLRLADLQEVCALASWHDAGGIGLLMGAARGVARWQAGFAHMLPWPEVLAPDNHLAIVG